MVIRWLIAVISLPVMVLGVIPALLLLVARHTRWDFVPASPVAFEFWLGLVCGLSGLSLGAWTVGLFMRFGAGTAAPWDPPRKFVIRGPYRHVRNPMIAGVFLMLLAESLLLHSWPIFTWMAVFVTANLVYIPRVEEPGLERRFGAEYAVYKRHVPRWIPRLTPWTPNSEDAQR